MKKYYCMIHSKKTFNCRFDVDGVCNGGYESDCFFKTKTPPLRKLIAPPLKPTPKVIYQCDRRACKNCGFPKCTMTSDISHAVNFQKIGGDNDKQIYYIERDAYENKKEIRKRPKRRVNRFYKREDRGQDERKNISADTDNT